MIKLLSFADRMTYDPHHKTAVSMRDGVLEYLGVELGKEPADKVFRIYRSPATISNATMKMTGIPLTDEHVSLEESAPEGNGMVESSEMIDAIDPFTHTTIATRNKLSISDALRASVESGKRELSLGYIAELVPHDEYDFEQKDIMPHHLAVVTDGRCGSMCSFIDRKPLEEEPTMKKLHKAFLDAEGTMNLQQIAEVVAAFPEAIRQMPLEQVQKLMPILQEAMTAAKEVGVEPEDMTDENEADKIEEKDAEADPEKEQEATDADKDDEDEKPGKFGDSAEFKDAVAAQAKALTDEAVKRHTEVIEKAKTFVDSEYSFIDKTTKQIMRDSLATESSEKFEDAELSMAFKLLKKVGNYKTFGDNSGAEKFTKLADKEL